MKIQAGWHYLGIVLCVSLVHFLPDPHLLPVRYWAESGLMVLALLGIVATAWSRVIWQRRLIVLLWLIVISLAVLSATAISRQRVAVLQAYADDPALMAKLGQHLVVGYDQLATVRDLARRGLIGGVFVTQRNAAGKSVEQLRAELALLQHERRLAKLPPLLIATDQEGGPVSRLSPPLAQQAALSSVLADNLSAAEIELRATHYGAQQGRALAALGVNTNFSPVVDLKPSAAPGMLDVHTRIAERAIDADPQRVALVALAYSRALLAQGVMPTLKHFPGLGRVTTDTHHFNADLNTPVSALATHDWLPFRSVLDQTPAMLMVGHVRVNALDATRPASLSRPVLNDLLRQQWGFQGVLISDDLSMAPIYRHGLCRASVEALNAGMDLLLLSYDWQKYYAVMNCLQQAAHAGRLQKLEQSRQRLQSLPWRKPTQENL